MTTASNKIKPNTFQKPNLYTDQLMHLLDGDEYKTLDYAVRRTMGFHQRSARISQKEFRKGNGLRDADGRLVEYGTGLGENKQRAALQSLVAFGILVEVAPFDRERQLGTEYELQLDETLIDWEGLEARVAEKAEKDRKRTRNARKAKAKAVDNSEEAVDNSPSLVAQARGGTLVTQATPPLCDKPPLPCVTSHPSLVRQVTPPLSHIRVLENQLESQLENQLENQGGAGGKKRPSKARENGKVGRKSGKEGDEGLEIAWGMCLAFCKGDIETAARIWQLQKHFSVTTTLPVDIDTSAGRRQLERDWWPHLRQVLANAGGDVDEAMISITEAVERMDKARLTCTSPRSVVNLAAAALAERRRGADRQPKRVEPKGFEGIREYMRRRGLSGGLLDGQ